MRILRALLPVLLLAPAPAVAQTGPPYSVPEKELAAALECPAPLAGVARAPVLLVPGTNLEPKANFDWNYMPALSAAGIPWCAVTLPRYGMGDIQVSAEYVLHALRTMHAAAGRRVSVLGFSQGGMIGRWVLRWWPDTRTMIEDLVGLAPSNHGTHTAIASCSTACAAAYWQQRSDAKFIAALNDGPETFAGIDYTVAYTRTDEVVTPNTDDATGSSPLRTGDGRIRNVAIQEVCPADAAEHLTLGSTDPVGWALAIDALTHDGPADPARIDSAVCAQPAMPGVDPATFPADYLRYYATVGQGSAQADNIPAEPPPACYVTRSCPAVASAPAAPRPARACRRTIALDRRLRRVTVTVAGERVAVRRRKGRLTVRVPLRPGRATAVRVRGIRSGGRRVRFTRRLPACG